MEIRKYDWESMARRRVEEMNEEARRLATITGAPALIMNPETGRLHMEGLRPGQVAYFEHNGVRHLFHG
jgi:hypothetical protein